MTDEEFYAFCILVDFTSRCFISDIFYDKLKAVHEAKPFDANASFGEMKMFYLKHATNYFKEIKELFKDKIQILKIIEAATDWTMNDEQFKE